MPWAVLPMLRMVVANGFGLYDPWLMQSQCVHTVSQTRGSFSHAWMCLVCLPCAMTHKDASSQSSH